MVASGHIMNKPESCRATFYLQKHHVARETMLFPATPARASGYYNAGTFYYVSCCAVFSFAQEFLGERIVIAKDLRINTGINSYDVL